MQSLPRDLLDEVEIELRAATRSSDAHQQRLRTLRELRRLAASLAADLGRPITAADLLRTGEEPAERERRRALVRTLRSGS